MPVNRRFFKNSLYFCHKRMASLPDPELFWMDRNLVCGALDELFDYEDNQSRWTG